ncbi:conserved hypothetical protein [Halorhabdus tiamatea SARL4B]|uniref:Asl1-like glycosyl hydrolase catalytic domain-containing protein n=1 Tax=Halorhabdus tiamatea SARL4B TaxID=1033806 RepID=S6CT66_9EURY|nr:conserved hypothetical protein [Halorhabdus tiamatea SARL4B]
MIVALVGIIVGGGFLIGGADVAVADTENGDPPTLEIGQTTTGNVFLADEQPRVTVESDAPSVEWTVQDHRGRLIDDGTTPVDGERTLEPSLHEVGHYTLEVETTGEEQSATARTTLAVLPADGFDNDDPFFGMSTQFNAGWDHELMDVMARAGVTTVREDSGWSRIERAGGAYDFSPADEYMTALQEHGFDRLYILAYGNDRYDPENSGYFTIPYTDAYRRAFANFSAASVDHYADVDVVEVWNEPNLDTFARGPTGTDPGAYAALLAATYPAVHDRDRNVTVLGGAAAANYTGEGVRPFDATWWRGLLEAGGGEYMDAMSIHLYRDEPTGFARDLSELREMTREHNDGDALPIWVTELGWPATPTSPGGEQSADQARHLVQSYARLSAAGVERFYWYTFRDTTLDRGTTPQTAEANALGGLLRAPDNPRGAHTPRPGLVAYATVTRQLSGAEFVENASRPVQQYVFADGGERTRVLWADERTDVTVHTDEPVSVTGMLGDRTRLEPRDGEVYLTVGRDPIYLGGTVSEITAGAPVSVAGPVTSASEESTITVNADLDGPVTHRIAGETTTVDGGTTGSIPVPSSHRDRAGTAVDVVSVDGAPIARLETPVGAPTARLGEPSELSGLTLETANPGGGWFSEANDVGTAHSAFTATIRDGRQCWRSDITAGRPGNSLHLDIPNGHLDAGADRQVSVAYYDGTGGEIGLQYDGVENNASWGGSVSLTGTEQWRTHTFDLPSAALRDGLGAGHDIRLVFDGGDGDACVGSITVGSEGAPPLPASADSSSPGDRPPSSTATATPTGNPADNDTTTTTSATVATGPFSPTGSDVTTTAGPGFSLISAFVAVLATGHVVRRSE